MTCERTQLFLLSKYMHVQKHSGQGQCPSFQLRSLYTIFPPLVHMIYSGSLLIFVLQVTESKQGPAYLLSKSIHEPTNIICDLMANCNMGVDFVTS